MGKKGRIVREVSKRPVITLKRLQISLAETENLCRHWQYHKLATDTVCPVWESDKEEATSEKAHVGKPKLVEKDFVV